MSDRDGRPTLMNAREAASLDMMRRSEGHELIARWAAAVSGGLTVFSATMPHSHIAAAGVAGAATGVTVFFGLTARHESTQAAAHRQSAATYKAADKIASNSNPTPS